MKTSGTSITKKRKIQFEKKKIKFFSQKKRPKIKIFSHKIKV